MRLMKMILMTGVLLVMGAAASTAAVSVAPSAGAGVCGAESVQDSPEANAPAADGIDGRLQTIVKEAVRIFQGDEAPVWPGYDLARQPFLVYRPDRWALLVNPEGPAEGFGPLPDGWTSPGTKALFHSGKYGDLAGQLVFDLPAGEARVAAVGIPDGLFEQDTLHGLPVDTALLAYIVHENFHKYQNAAFGEIPWAREERYPLTDVESAALAALELHVLKDILTAVDNHDRATGRELARRFAAVRIERWTRAGDWLGRFEQGLEVKEGSAKYVEVQCVARVRPSIAPTTAGDPVPSPSLGGLPAVEQVRRNVVQLLAEDALSPEDLPRNRVYPLGGGLGLLLDELGVAWKKELETDCATFAFHRQLARHYGWSATELAAVLPETMERYDHAALRTKAAERLAAYGREYVTAMAEFNAQPGWRLVLAVSSNGVSRSRVSTARKWLMDSGTKSLCRHYRVYSLKTKNWQFQLKDSALFEENDWDARRKQVTVVMPGPPNITLDSRPAVPETPESSAFQNLVVTADNRERVLKQAGQIRVHASGKEWRIMLE
ncbi:MAG: hypothetical protein JXQ27_08120 [Acidobacteria bacterium]|nr:hypothetical protein [Acidobacteriota bacterium]